MKYIWIYVVFGLVALFFVWVSWQVFVRTLPPIKVEIVSGCK